MERPCRRLAGAAPTAAEPARLTIPHRLSSALALVLTLPGRGQRSAPWPAVRGGLVSTPVNSMPARMTAMDAGKLVGGSEAGLVLPLLSALPRQRRHDGSATCVQARCLRAADRQAGRAGGRRRPFETVTIPVVCQQARVLACGFLHS